MLVQYQNVGTKCDILSENDAVTHCQYQFEENFSYQRLILQFLSTFFLLQPIMWGCANFLIYNLNIHYWMFILIMNKLL